MIILLQSIFTLLLALTSGTSWCMHEDMPTLVPDDDSTLAGHVSSPAGPAFPRTVPSLVMCCMKPAVLAYLEEKSKNEYNDGESDTALNIFHDPQKSEAWLQICKQITTRLGRPDALEAFYHIGGSVLPMDTSTDVLQARWRNSYHRYSNMYGHLGSPSVGLDYVLKYNRCGWNNENDFLHYFDEMLAKLIDQENIEAIYKDAIFHEAPFAIYQKFAALGVQIYHGHYLDYAVVNNKRDYAEHLLEQGVSPADSTFQYGLLHYLVSQSHFYPSHAEKSYTLLQLLTYYGADLAQKNAEGLTPGDVAWLMDKEEMANFLDTHEDARNKTLFIVEPITLGGVIIPEGISPYRQRWIRRLDALEKKYTHAS